MERGERGITLIALIITIIVMLILVGVTVAVALNGGLFSTAKKATTDTQIEADRETLQAGIIGALNKDLKIPNMDILKSNLPENWEVIEEEDGTYTVRSAKGNEYKVNENGIVDESQDSSEEWWKLTEEESAMLDENRQFWVAMKKEGNKTTGVIYAEEGSHIFVQIAIDLVDGMVEENSLVLTFYSGDDIPEEIINRWVNMHNEPFGVYTGECPISLDDFSEDEIHCRSLLERIMESFNK